MRTSNPRRPDRRSSSRGPWRRQPHRGVASIAITIALALGSVARAADPPTPAPEVEVPGLGSATISPDEVSRGQKGYGLSVFAGTEPERFEVEVLGVLRNSTPELSYILARLSGQDLERSGVVAGMSGSPVYLDDRLAGAVAFSWVFGLDAIAGITPIDAMRRLSQLPAGSSVRRAAAPAELAIGLDDLRRRDFSSDLLARQLDRLRPPIHSGARSTVQWTASGFGEAATALLQHALGELTPAGASGGGGATGAGELAPGSAVAAVLVRGDLNLAAHGTVTDRRGDELLAFGHPVFSLGPVNLPLAASEVVTVIANTASSFKVSNAGEAIGAFDQDRQAGVRGRLGLVAPTTPLTVRLRGLARREYRMEVANLPPLRPILLAISALGALDSGSYAGGAQGLDLDATIVLRDRDDLPLRQSFDGEQAAIDSVIYLLTFAAFLEFNPLAEVEIESVEVELSQVERPRSAILQAAHPARTRVEPGEAVPVTLELVAYRGERYRRESVIEVPAAAPDGRYVVLIGDGTSMDAARMSFERQEPKSFAQVLELLRSLRSRRELVLLGLRPSPGLAVGGEVLPDLPGSVRSIFAAGSSPAAKPLWLAAAHQQVEALDRPIEGLVRVDLEVRRRPR